MSIIVRDIQRKGRPFWNDMNNTILSKIKPSVKMLQAKKWELANFVAQQISQIAPSCADIGMDFLEGGSFLVYPVPNTGAVPEEGILISSPDYIRSDGTLCLVEFADKSLYWPQLLRQPEKEKEAMYEKCCILLTPFCRNDNPKFNTLLLMGEEPVLEFSLGIDVFYAFPQKAFLSDTLKDSAVAAAKWLASATNDFADINSYDFVSRSLTANASLMAMHIAATGESNQDPPYFSIVGEEELIDYDDAMCQIALRYENSDFFDLAMKECSPKA